MAGCCAALCTVWSGRRQSGALALTVLKDEGGAYQVQRLAHAEYHLGPCKAAGGLRGLALALLALDACWGLVCCCTVLCGQTLTG